MKPGYSSEPLSFNRKMVAASASVTARKNTIHSMAEVDITEPRRRLKAHFEKTGQKLSLTAYIVYCLAQVIRDHPHLNSFVRRNRLITLDEVTVSVLIEREFDGENAPEPVSIKAAQDLTYLEINNQIREAQSDRVQQLGTQHGMSWVRFIPGFLLRSFIRIADHNLKMAARYGKIAVTAVGMFSKEPIWFIPHGSTVGSIEKRHEISETGPKTREYLCLTASFDHDIVDGAPAARFMNQFLETLGSGKYLSMIQDQA